MRLRRPYLCSESVVACELRTRNIDHVDLHASHSIYTRALRRRSIGKAFPLGARQWTRSSSMSTSPASVSSSVFHGLWFNQIRFPVVS